MQSNREGSRRDPPSAGSPPSCPPGLGQAESRSQELPGRWWGPKSLICHLPPYRVLGQSGRGLNQAVPCLTVLMLSWKIHSALLVGSPLCPPALELGPEPAAPGGTQAPWLAPFSPCGPPVQDRCDFDIQGPLRHPWTAPGPEAPGLLWYEYIHSKFFPKLVCWELGLQTGSGAEGGLGP